MGERAPARRHDRGGQPAGGRRALRAAVALVALAATACGVRPTDVVPGGPAPTVGSHEMTLYFVSSDGQLVRRTRFVTGEFTQVLPVQALLAGPNDDEKRAGLTTELPVVDSPVVQRGGTILMPVEVKLLSRTALDQLVCTAGATGLSLSGVLDPESCP